MYLIGDVGGTKTNLAVIEENGEWRDWRFEAAYTSAAFDNLEELLKGYIQEHGFTIRAACLGVAGPVLDGRASITNLPWTITEKGLAQALNIEKVEIINDLVATARAIPCLDETDVEKLNQGTAAPGGPIAVLAPGTGLGEAYLTWDGRRYRTHASEGGHVDFAPATALQWGLLHYLQGKFGHVSYERVCSGMGIANIYQYLKETGYAEEPPWFAEKLKTRSDPTPLIVEAALDSALYCELCRATLYTFCAILGAEAGNMALKLLATGGIYLGGGIPPRILPLLRSEKFFFSYRDKGRFEDFLDQVPVYVILNPKAALLGAASSVLGTE